jgi:hypothetical protein
LRDTVMSLLPLAVLRAANGSWSCVVKDGAAKCDASPSATAI